MNRALSAVLLMSGLLAPRFVFAQVTYGVAAETFPAGSMKVDTDISLRAPIVIKIDKSEGGLLTAAQDSAVPTDMALDKSGKLQMRFLTHAVGVTWLFTKAGLSFVADGKRYTSEKAGATIEFTKSGVKMTAIKVTPYK